MYILSLFVAVCRVNNFEACGLLVSALIQNENNRETDYQSSVHFIFCKLCSCRVNNMPRTVEQYVLSVCNLSIHTVHLVQILCLVAEAFETSSKSNPLTGLYVCLSGFLDHSNRTGSSTGISSECPCQRQLTFHSRALFEASSHTFHV